MCVCSSVPIASIYLRLRRTIVGLVSVFILNNGTE